MNFQEKISCKSESEVYPDIDCQSLKFTQSLKIHQKLKWRTWSSLLWIFEDTNMQKE